MTVTYVRELTVKYRGNKGQSFDPIRFPDDAAKLLRRVLPDNVREHFVALFLDSRHQVVGYFVVATGTASSCPVGAREVFQAALFHLNETRSPTGVAPPPAEAKRLFIAAGGVAPGAPLGGRVHNRLDGGIHGTPPPFVPHPTTRLLLHDSGPERCLTSAGMLSG